MSYRFHSIRMWRSHRANCSVLLSDALFQWGGKVDSRSKLGPSSRAAVAGLKLDIGEYRGKRTGLRREREHLAGSGLVELITRIRLHQYAKVATSANPSSQVFAGGSSTGAASWSGLRRRGRFARRHYTDAELSELLQER